MCVLIFTESYSPRYIVSAIAIVWLRC